MDVYTGGSQESVCLTTPTAGLSRSGYLGFVLELAYGVAYGFAQGSTFHEFDKRQQRLTTNGSTRQLALMSGVYALAEHRRQDGWTSTPRASRRATA